MKSFGSIMFTDPVRAEQARRGSAELGERLAARPAPESLGPSEQAFISARNSFYMATVSASGWPYIQHRGGPSGFLKVIGPTTIGFGDYAGNRQYVSTGNLASERRTALFLMDYPNRRRLKLLGLTKVQEAGDNPALAEAFAVAGQGVVERLFTIEVQSFDWNCPQFITPRFTEAELAPSLAPIAEELETLRRENAELRARLAP